MFKNLQDRFTAAFDKLKSKGVLSEALILKSLKEVRVALIEADVALPVVKQFIAKGQQHKKQRQLRQHKKQRQLRQHKKQQQRQQQQEQEQYKLHHPKYTAPPLTMILSGIKLSDLYQNGKHPESGGKCIKK